MTSPSLSEIIDGRLISQDAEIRPTADEPVRSIDVLGNVAAVHRFSVDEDGDWFENCTLAAKAPDGSWMDTGSGGSHGGAWEIPWRPSQETLNGRFIVVWGSSGSNVPVEGDRTVFARGMYGFVAPPVREVRVTSESGTRTLPVDSPVGTFVALVLNEGAVEFQGLDGDGNPVGEPVVRVLSKPERRSRLRRRHFRRWKVSWGRSH